MYCRRSEVLSGFMLKNSPEWSAQYSGSGPLSRQHSCRRGRSCPAAAAKIRDQNIQMHAPAPAPAPADSALCAEGLME